MFSATFVPALDPPWLQVEPVVLGDPSARGREPDCYVLITGGGLHVRCDIHDDRYSTFADVQPWRERVVIGYGARVHCVHPPSRAARTHELEWYFGGIYLEGDVCLISSAQELLRLGPDGSVHWTAANVGIDGVIVDRIEGDTIFGQGEWDPPDGWRPFKVRLSTGEILTAE